MLHTSKHWASCGPQQHFETRHSRTNLAHFVFRCFPGPHQRFEIDKSNMLILARKCGQNEVVSKTKSWHTTTALRDSPLGPQVGKQLFGEWLNSWIIDYWIIELLKCWLQGCLNCWIIEISYDWSIELSKYWCRYCHFPNM